MPITPNSIKQADEMSHPKSHSVSGMQRNENKIHQGNGDNKLYSSKSIENSTTYDIQLKDEVDRLKLALKQSFATAKKMEIELETLKNSNACLTSALDTYKQENLRMKAKYEGDLENSKVYRTRSVGIQPKTNEMKLPMDTKDEDQQMQFDKIPETSDDSKDHEYEIKLDTTDEDQQIHFDRRPGTSDDSKGHKHEIKLDTKDDDQQIKFNIRLETSDASKGHEHEIKLFQDTKDEDQQIQFDNRPGTSADSKGHKHEIKLDTKDEDQQIEFDRRPGTSGVSKDLKYEIKLDTKDEDQQIEFDKRPGTSGASKGHKYEIKLVMFFLLQGKITKEIESFYLATNMDGIGDFDDVVLKYTYNKNGMKKRGIIFVQAKHKETTKIFNFYSLFPRGKGDFDLRKYLRSYEDIKQQFKTNRNHPIFKNEFDVSKYFIFTNTSFYFNNCKDDVEEYEMKQEDILNLKKNARCYKVKDSDKVINELRKSPNFNLPDVEIREFLNKLRIFDSHYNEKELEEELNKMIESTYSVNKSEAALIFFEVYREIEIWWQSEKTHYITKKNMFFENAKQNVSKRSLVVPASLFRAQMEALKLRFKKDHVKKLMELINKNQILNIVTTTVILTNAKVYQALEDMAEYKSKESEENDYKYLFVSSQLTTDIQNKIINTFKSTQFNLLVLGCEGNKDKFENLFIELSHIIKGDVNKKIIMIGEENKKATIFDGLVRSYKKYEDTETLIDLNDESQENLVNKVTAIFQGEEVIFGKLLKAKKIKELVNKEILSEMVNGSKINIGESLKNLGEIEKYYINRIFNRDVNINTDFFVTKSNERIYSVKEEDIISINDKVVIISAEPGMGKSTALTKLAQQIKKSDPSLWVQTVNLNDHTDHLQRMDLQTIDKNKEAIKVLLKIVKPKVTLEVELFKHKINDEGKIVFLFDGFDEISPTYDNKVIELLKVLNNTKAEKLWITTRPHMRRKLENKLGVIAYTLRPLTKDNQVTFLKKFWKERLAFDKDFDIRTNLYISELLDLLKRSISDMELQFTGIPLQTRMLAEVFQENFKDFHDSKKEVPNLPKTLNVVYLYREFIDKKCRIFYEEKKGVSLTRTAIKKEYCKFFYPSFLRNHKILGIDLIIYQKNEFLSVDEHNILKKIKNDFNEEDDKTGIVIQIVDNKPIFVHRTFAEYFAALWFADKVEGNDNEIKNKLVKYIFKKEYEVLKIFFDRLLIDDECEIHNAVLSNDECKVNLLLDDIKVFDKGGRIALHLAAAYGYDNILKILLENTKFKNKIDMRDKVFNWSALMYAVKGKYWSTVELLLQYGAKSDDIFETNSRINETKYSVGERTVMLMHIAAEKGYVKLIDVLLINKAKYRPIAQRVAAKIDKVLLNHENIYDIDYKGEWNQTPLYVAVKHEQLEVVKLLVNNGANINAITAFDHNSYYDFDFNSSLNCNEYEDKDELGWSILHMAVYKGNKEIVKFLINNQADTNAVDRSGKTPLYISIERGNDEVATLLDKTGRNVFLFYSELGEFERVKTILKGKSKEERKLLCNPTQPGRCGPLHKAVKNGFYDIVELLVDNGADVNTFDENGFTPLHISVDECYLKIFDFLMNKERLLNCCSDMFRVFYSAAKGGDTIFKRIIELNPESIKTLINVTFNNDTTLLHRASGYGNVDTVKFLVENNANINAVDIFGGTPLFSAAIGNNYEVVKYLLNQNGIRLVNDSTKLFGMLEITPLHIASIYDNLEVAKLLFEKSSSLVHAGEANSLITPYHFANRFKGEITSKYLLKNGANIVAEYKILNVIKIVYVYKGLHDKIGEFLNELHELLEPPRSRYEELNKSSDYIKNLLKFLYPYNKFSKRSSL